MLTFDEFTLTNCYMHIHDATVRLSETINLFNARVPPIPGTLLRILYNRQRPVANFQQERQVQSLADCVVAAPSTLGSRRDMAL